MGNGQWQKVEISPFPLLPAPCPNTRGWDEFKLLDQTLPKPSPHSAPQSQN